MFVVEQGPHYQHYRNSVGFIQDLKHKVAFLEQLYSCVYHLSFTLKSNYSKCIIVSPIIIRTCGYLIYTH